MRLWPDFTVFKDTLAPYLDRRIAWVFLMGCASGFPWVLIGSAMSGWLKDAGLTRTAIGLFGSIFAVYAINFLWAPLVDRIRLPGLSRFCQRRSWILLTQLIMLGAVCLTATVDPAQRLWLTSLIALSIAIASSTQDIAIDAFRIDHFSQSPKQQLPAASAMAVIGWWTGYSLPGYLAFSQADVIGWANVYWLMALVLVGLIAATLIVREPHTDRDRLQADAEARYRSHLQWQRTSRLVTLLLVTVVEPFAEFLRRNGTQTALLIFAICVLV